ncbi:MAG: hypothetical protein GOMPHAMPRED_005455 [Gomphillus americanus]|uniref:Uncharacterized protein n=1 Tax=Gomphillus americanus TaxID=1940652 RepID=A0A8H3IVF4_9LECA|nr:MAG: hypothetical protein GOMPHAMPRED_005455 [Gomphillus americanus]
MPTIPGTDDFHIAVSCAPGIESEAVEGLFDQEFQSGNLLWQKADGDQNSYTISVIGRHKVVLAYMPSIGKVNAARTASSISATFLMVRLALVTRVCGVFLDVDRQQILQERTQSGTALFL